jgi:hypothetical protein
VLDELVEILKHSALEECEERDPEAQKRTVEVSKLTEGLGLAAAGIKVFEDINLYSQRAATTRQGTVRILAYDEEILMEKKRSSIRQTSAFDLFESPSETRASPSALLHIGND